MDVEDIVEDIVSDSGPTSWCAGRAVIWMATSSTTPITISSQPSPSPPPHSPRAEVRHPGRTVVVVVVVVVR